VADRRRVQPIPIDQHRENGKIVRIVRIVLVVSQRFYITILELSFFNRIVSLEAVVFIALKDKKRES
jgi:hypothetical protein